MITFAKGAVYVGNARGIDTNGGILVARDAVDQAVEIMLGAGQEGKKTALAVALTEMGIGDYAVEVRRADETVGVDLGAATKWVGQGFGRQNGADGSGEIQPSEYRPTRAGAAEYPLAVGDRVANQAVDDRTPPIIDVTGLIATGQPDGLCFANGGMDVGVVSGTGVVEDDGFHGVQGEAELVKKVVVVAVGTTGTEHEYVATVGPYEEPAHGVSVFGSAAHQTAPAVGVGCQGGSAARVIAYVVLGADAGAKGAQ